MKVGPNDPCGCGSGKKYKKCCWTKDQQVQAQAAQDARGAIADEPAASADVTAAKSARKHQPSVNVPPVRSGAPRRRAV